ncbi:MAG TPA: LysR family transcriptional regulator [Sphingomonas sp.]
MTDSPHPPNAAPVPVRAQWTPAKQRIFITALLETGSVARAARAAGMSRSSAHRLRVRLAGTPFDRQWDHALQHHARRMADPFASQAQPGGSTAVSQARP